MSTTIAGNYDGSFAGASFWEQWDGAFAPEPDVKTKDAILEIPGSNNAYYQDFGQAVAGEFQLNVAVASLSSIQSKRGVRGSLVYHAGTITARLRHITNIQRDSLSLGYKVTLTFLVG